MQYIFHTRYDRDGAFPFQCFLYSDCAQVEEDCAHCYSGPGMSEIKLSAI